MIQFLIYGIVVLASFYLIWGRVIVMYYKVYQYSTQGVPFHSFVLPFLGSFASIGYYIAKNPNSDLHPILGWNQHTYQAKDGKLPPFTGNIMPGQVSLIINSPEVMQELLVTKNKVYDKHPYTKRGFQRILGDSIVFQNSNQVWAAKRKVISSSLYKEKLIRMTEDMKEIVSQIMNEWETKGTIDIVQETSNLLIRIISSCLFGRKNENLTVKITLNGVVSEVPLGQAMQINVGRVMERDMNPILMLFPELTPYFFLTKSDRELAKNADAVRDLIRSLALERQQDIKEGKEGVDDFIEMLIKSGDVFNDNVEMIVDECITFYFAGSQTTASSISNLICYLAQLSDIDEKVRLDMKTAFLNFGQSNNDLKKEMNMESVGNLNYLKLCFNESLRIEPPVPLGSSICLSEDADICGVHIKQGDLLFQNLYQLHHNPHQWVEHEKFIPERFDPKNEKYYLTPEGKPRHVMSYIPFLGGKRVCIGKTFAETVFKFTVPIILNTFKFDYADQQQRLHKPQNNILQFKKPQIMMRLTKMNKK